MPEIIHTGKELKVAWNTHPANCECIKCSWKDQISEMEEQLLPPPDKKTYHTFE